MTDDRREPGPEEAESEVDDEPTPDAVEQHDESAAGAAAGGGARSEGGAGEADRAISGDRPSEAAAGAKGILGRFQAVFGSLTREERWVSTALGTFFGVIFLATAVGVLNLSYALYLLALAGMYLLLSMGLNVQWGYTGLINFSVAAFFGLGAYGTALLTSSDSPILGGVSPLLGLVAGLVLAGVVAVLIGIPTLSLREDYLAIASLGLAEVVRMIINNEEQWTGGSAGLYGIPRFFEGIPGLAAVPRGAATAFLNLVLVSLFVVGTYLFLRRIHRSPWGRVQRTIRADEDLASALGKDTYRFKMESFVIGSVVMALAGVFYAHLQLFISPSALEPTQTFYVWIAVILGGTGSDRGAMLGGLTIIAIQQGTRFLGGTLPIDAGAFRLFLIGFIIILIMRYRPEGILPPQRELVWPGARGGEADE